jgi:hypothetical protein
MKRTLRMAAGILVVAAAGGMLHSEHARAQAMITPAPSYFLALGDALSLSPIAHRASGRRTCTATLAQSGFVCPLWNTLRRSMPGLREFNLALATSPAEDSCSFRLIAACACTHCTASGAGDQQIREDLVTRDRPSYDPTRTSQLSAALAFIQAHPGQVRVISLEIGGADLQELASQEPLTPAREQVVAGRMSQNFQAIAAALHQAAPGARLILMDAIDPFTPLLKSRDSMARATAAHMQPFYASFSRVVAAEATFLGAIHAGVWRAFQSRATSEDWMRNCGAGALTSAGYRLYSSVVWHAYAAYSAARPTVLPKA